MTNEFRIRVNSKEETERLGEMLGSLLSGGEVIELSSDLGGGKTTLTKGIARGVGSSDSVSSPTFTISNVYRGSTLTIHHYDFYRLGELGLMGEELNETMSDPKVIVVMEWADEARRLLPESRSVHINIDLVADDEYARDITIRFGLELQKISEKFV